VRTIASPKKNRMSTLWHISKRVAAHSYQLQPADHAHGPENTIKSPSVTVNNQQLASGPRLRHHFHGAEKSSPRRTERPSPCGSPHPPPPGVSTHITGSKSRLAPRATAIPPLVAAEAANQQGQPRAPRPHSQAHCTVHTPAHTHRVRRTGETGAWRGVTRAARFIRAIRCPPLCSPLCFPVDFSSWLLSRAEAVGIT
jgi:hypothetical protein